MIRVNMRVLASLIAATAVGMLPACGGRSEAGLPIPALTGTPYEVPSTSAAAREVRNPTSLEEMIEIADLVVVGAVREANVGRTVGNGPDEGAFQMRELTVIIESILKGTTNAETLLVEEEGYFQGRPYSVNDSRWARPGARAVFFLRQRQFDPEGILYGLVNTHARFFLHQNRVIANIEGDLNSFESSAEQLSASEFVETVRRSER